MNIFLNEYFGFCFELNFELNHFSARFNEKMNFQNVSPTPYLDPLPHSSDPVLRVGDKGEAASSEASVYLPTLAWTRLQGPGLYELTALKRMEATKSYLAQTEQVKGCSDQSFEDCKAHAFLKLTLERCSCLPWTLSGILNVSSQFSDFLSAPVNFCSPAQFRSFF